MQSTNHQRVRRTVRNILIVAPFSAAIVLGSGPSAVAAIPAEALTPITTPQVEPGPAPPSNILQLALPLILIRDAREAASEKARESDPAVHVNRPALTVPLPKSHTPALALAALGALTLAGGIAFAGFARRKV